MPFSKEQPSCLTMRAIAVPALVAIVSGSISAVLTVMLVYEDPNSAEFWINRFEESTTPRERETAVFVLHQRFSEREDVVETFVSALSDPDPGVRKLAILGLQDNREAIRHIRKLKDDPDSDVRKLVNDILHQANASSPSE